MTGMLCFESGLAVQGGRPAKRRWPTGGHALHGRSPGPYVPVEMHVGQESSLGDQSSWWAI